MTRIQGRYFDGQSSRPRAAVITGDTALVLQVEGQDLRPVVLADLRISDRLGSLPRQIWFADGASFETEDNDAIDRLLGQGGLSASNLFLHGLESRWSYTLIGVVLVAVLAWLGFTVGLPAFSRVVAERLPERLYELVSEQTLDLLQQNLLQESRLPPNRRLELHTQFEALVRDLDWEPGFRLYLLDSRDGGLANAFALPDGSVVVTDGLVALSGSDEEIMAVLAHEAGHVVLRHGMRRLVQSSLLVFAGIMVTGDTSGFSATALGVPTLLLELSYSREFEREADAFAVELMRNQGGDPLALAQMLGRLHRHHGGSDGLGDYLSTHPATDERMAEIRRLANTPAP